MEENNSNPSPVTMILYTIDNDKKNPTQNWEIIPKKKYTIGRSKKEVDLPLSLKLLSRKHAELIYYDSKTIMIKDLGSRNGTFINKIKIDPLKESFFTNKEVLSFGNLNNEIVFFDNSEQPKEEVPQTDSEKSKNSDIEKEEKSEPNEDINNNDNAKIYKNEIFEEINTDIKRNREEEKEKYSLNNHNREIESNSEKRIIRENNISNSKEISNQRDLNREQNKDKSVSNRANFDDRKPSSYINSSNNNIYVDRSDAHHYTDKSRSRENKNTSPSRSGSIETLVQQYRRNQQTDNLRINQEISFKNNNYQDISHKNEIESEREKEGERERLRYREKEKERERDRERERSRRDSNERSYRAKIERDIREDKYMMRKRYEEMRRRDEKEREEYNQRLERERDYKERERKSNYDERERNYNERERERNYNERRRESDNNYNKYFEEGNKIILKPEKLDIVMNQNYEKSRNNYDDNKDGDMGYIKCYVEGYMYLKIRRNENN